MGNVEKGVKVLSTQVTVLQEMSYGLMRVSTGERQNLKGLMNAYENWGNAERLVAIAKEIQTVSE